jgi:hypothetical protein
MDKLEFKTDGRVLGEASLDVDPKLKVIDYLLLFFRIFEDLNVNITHPLPVLFMNRDNPSCTST